MHAGDASKNAVKNKSVESIRNHSTAFAYFVDQVEHKANIQLSDIVHVCHRVVHGGDYSNPVIIRDDTYHYIERLSDLAPLHNGAALAVINDCIKNLPNANSVAIDQTIPQNRGLKKYGFHGLSYAYILRIVARYLNKTPSSLNLIVLHLGSGDSACAIQGGKSLDTSMGLTPLNGLPGTIRSGAVDPSLIFHYTNEAGRISHDPKQATDLRVIEAEQILNVNSGWKSLTGITDFALITHRAQEGSKKDQLAFNLFVDRILNYVGSYHLKLQGKVDALVFSGGIGERSKELRKYIAENIACLSYAAIDEAKNNDVDRTGGEVINIGEGLESCRKLLVCRTDEQFEMAYECAQRQRGSGNFDKNQQYAGKERKDIYKHSLGPKTYIVYNFEDSSI